MMRPPQASPPRPDLGERLPLVGVCAAPGPGLTALLAGLEQWVPLTSCTADGSPLHGPAPDVLLGGPVDDRRPAIQLARAGDTVREDAVAVLSADAATRRLAGARGVAVPTRPDRFASTRSLRWMPPFVRARVRGARGPGGSAILLADDHGFRWADDEATSLPAALGDGLLSRCAAAWATDEEVACRALAWGAPLVVPPAVARALAGREADCYLVATPARRDDVLRGLVEDPAEAARLSWRARRWYEDACDYLAAGTRLATLLLDRVGHADPRGIAHAELALAELGTPPDGRMRERLLVARERLVGVDSPDVPDLGGPAVTLPAPALWDLEPPATDPPAPDAGRLTPARLGRAAARRARHAAVRAESALLGHLSRQTRALAERLDRIESEWEGARPLLTEVRAVVPRELHDNRTRGERLQREVALAREEHAALAEAIAPAGGLPAAAVRMAELRERLYALERRVRQLTLEAGAAPAGGAAGTRPEPPPEVAARASAARPEGEPASMLFDYSGFERRFRGDPEVVNATLWERYGALLAGHAPVADLGCGRAELLERLAADGVEVLGVDSDALLASDARARGLAVDTGDAVRWLEGREPESLGAIIATHVVEHLPLDVLIRLLELARTRLRPGGVFVAETPNPTSLIVLGNSYVLDPTHVRPLHPALLVFLCEGAGFRDVDLRFFAPASGYQLAPVRGEEAPALAAEVNHAFDRLNQVLFGPQDYAVVATRG